MPAYYRPEGPYTNTEYMMAGQPQEPSWQPAAQDQAREAWPPPPSFTPQPGASRDTFAYPQPPAYGQQAQQGPQPSYSQQPPPAPAYGQPAPQAQPGQGYPPPAYDPASQDRAQGQDQGQSQGIPQWQEWQENPGMPPAASRRATGEKGFIGSLFDFSFQSMVTPKIIKVLYVLIAAWVVLWAIIFLVIAFRTGGVAGGIFTLIIVDPILVLLSLGAWRVILELCMVIFRLHEDVKALRDRGDGQI